MWSRRKFLGAAGVTATAWVARPRGLAQAAVSAGGPGGAQYAITPPLDEMLYSAVSLPAGTEESQRAQTQATLAELEDDSLLRPVRKMAGIAAPGASLGGWYAADGWAPSHCLGQWISAMARSYACDPAGGGAQKARVARLISGLQTMAPEALAASFRENPFPAYCYDKLLLALMDADALCGTPGARSFMAGLTAAAAPSLPAHAYSRNDMCSKPGLITKRTSCLDENYTLPENQFLAWRLTGERSYYDRGKRFLLNDSLFDPLAANTDSLIDQHAYSHFNGVSSALEAYFATGDPKYLRAAENGFRFVEEQSYPTGGWGPEEAFVDPASDRLEQDLTKTHRGFETPCGTYAHFKLARRLMRLTKDSRYGDSMERVLYNTIFGALPLQADGRAFYYSDYNIFAAKTYFPDRWPCCAGSIAMVAADYRRNIYLAEHDALYVNFYRPSTVSWGGMTLTQSGTYPLGPEVAMEVRTARPRQAVLHLRIPAWADGTEIAVNGKRVAEEVAPGRFFALLREWNDGDRVEITFPLRMRLQPLNARTPKYAALVRGPLALFGYIPDPDPREAELLLKAESRLLQAESRLLQAESRLLQAESKLLQAESKPGRAGFFEVATGGAPLVFSTFDQIPLAQSYTLFQRIA